MRRPPGAEAVIAVAERLGRHDVAAALRRELAPRAPARAVLVGPDVRPLADATRAAGVDVVDLGRLGGLGSPCAALLVDAASDGADAVVVVLAEHTAPTSEEIGVLRRLSHVTPLVVLAVPVDDAPAAATVLAQRLVDAGLDDVAVVPFRRRGGVRPVVARLTDELVAAHPQTDPRAAVVRAAGRLDRWCRDRLASPYESDTDRLDSAAATWRVRTRQLDDQMATLVADVEYDLHARLRLVADHLDAVVLRFDPALAHPHLADETRRRVCDEVAAHRGSVRRRLDAVATHLESMVVEDRAMSSPQARALDERMAPADPTGLLDALAALDAPPAEGDHVDERRASAITTIHGVLDDVARLERTSTRALVERRHVALRRWLEQLVDGAIAVRVGSTNADQLVSARRDLADAVSATGRPPP